MKINTLIKLIISLFCVFSCNVISAKPGDLDSSFGVNGVVLDSRPSSTFFGATLLDQQDKIVVSGEFEDDIVLIRYLKNGHIDSTFGKNGSYSFNSKLKRAHVFSMIETSDNHIIILGVYNNSVKESFENIFIYKINNNGIVDSSYGLSGLVTINDSTGSYFPNRIVELSNNQGVLILSTYTPNYKDFYSCFIKMLPSGKIEPFEKGNIFIISDDRYNVFFRDFIISDDKIILGGLIFTDTISYKGIPILYRLNKNFKPDEAFGEQGMVQCNVDHNKTIRFTKAIDDNSLIIGGECGSDTNGIFLSKYNVNGVPDLTFGIDGMVRTDIDQKDYLSSINVLKNENNRICISGKAQYSSLGYTIKYLFIQMFDRFGVPDSSFGKESKLYTRYPNENTDLGFSHLQTDDKILLIGSTFLGPASCILLYRYLTDFEVSVNDAVNDAEEFIYPNPVNNIVYINYELKSPDYINFELFNYFGDKIKDIHQLEFRESGNHNEIINLGDNLEDGLYLLKFSSSNNTRIFKIQVSK